MMNEHSDRSWFVKLILIAWFLRIVKPEWIIVHYVPALGFLRATPTLLIVVILIGTLIGSKRAKWDSGLVIFFVIVGISAFFATNTGIGREILRSFAELLILTIATLTYIDTESNIRKILNIYMFAFITFGIWGILGNGKIYAFMPLNNEDSFGPFMTMGIPMCYFLKANMKGWGKKIVWMGQYISIAAVIVSFARGTFLAFIAVLMYVLLRTKERKRLVLQMVVLGMIGISLVSLVKPNFIDEYSAEMSTIWGEGTEDGTGKDRIYLWSQGLEMFYDNPFLGVGPGCYAWAFRRYTSFQEATDWGVFTLTYGRHIHNIFLQVMAEMGILGIAGFLLLLFQFEIRTNALIRTRGTSGQKVNSAVLEYDDALTYRSWGLALEGALLGYLVNGVFYNLLFFSWLWDLIILNALVHGQSNKIKFK